MSDSALAAAPETRAGLSPFDGLPVLGVGIAVTNAGDGLSEALSVDPREFHHGERVYVVLECEVTKIAHVEVKKGEPALGLRRVHTLKAGDATIVDGDLVDAHLADQRARIEAARDRAEGVTRIPGTVPELDKYTDDGLDDYDPDADADVIPLGGS